MRAFDGATPVEDILAYVDRVRAAPALRDDLVGLLPEQAPIYAGRSANEAERIRGYMLASFETTGLPPAAIDYVLEELESGLNPYAVAAAAKAMRGAHGIPERAAPLLLQAIDRIRFSDDFVGFERGAAGPVGRTSTTALMELFRTLAWLGPRAGAALGRLQAMIGPEAGAFAPAVRVEIEKAVAAMSRAAATAPHACCAHAENSAAADPCASRSEVEDDIEGLELQDQSGAVLTFADFFRGRPGIMTFFYTRCMNPEKCSLTITQLARLQRRICEQQLHGRVNIAALTYDPAFDLPGRLHAYGTDRGMMFDQRNRMLRTTGPFELLRRRFDLGVGYGSVTVNRHRRELFVLDGKGVPILAIPRTRWDEDQVLGSLKSALASADHAKDRRDL
jgi:cytochrome oxidase Cu insertion factor (SCO1/SenC/PrrC family)